MIKKKLTNNMSESERFPIFIAITEDPENTCAKCCKTKQVINRMTEDIPILKEKFKFIYKDIDSKDIVEKFGNLKSPAILINNTIYSQGHVPIMKKLSRELLKIIH